MGASVASIVRSLSKEFVILVAISNAIAWPAAYLLMSSFLQEFPFRMSIGPGTFILTGVGAIVMAIASAAYRAIRAAQTNPVDALRWE